ncbi:hypothetical protein [Paracidovorax wautersii]|uniref:hypothetical protein n=1 Tax=Paracidovorax wautersii TaxID=1177982 RepID=UPI0031D6963D
MAERKKERKKERKGKREKKGKPAAFFYKRRQAAHAGTDLIIARYVDMPKQGALPRPAGGRRVDSLIRGKTAAGPGQPALRQCPP